MVVGVFIITPINHKSSCKNNLIDAFRKKYWNQNIFKVRCYTNTMYFEKHLPKYSQEKLF